MKGKASSGSAANATQGRGLEFLYFAYGSNMASRRLTDMSRAPSALRVAVGYVLGRRLAFDKYSRRDKSGKCDCEASSDAGDTVHGVVYRVALADRDALDRAEGLGQGYRKETITVIAGDAAYDAVTYVATDKRTGLFVYDWYLEHVLTGALENGLPRDYVDCIRRIPTVKDKDTERAGRERQIYQMKIER